MKTRVFAVCTVIFLFCGVAHADSAKLLNPANGHSYQRFDVAKIWPDAKTACANLGAHLATITSQAENDWVTINLLKESAYTSLGGTDQGHEGIWTWITGEQWSYSNWNTGEPNNGQGGPPQYFVAIYPTGKWDDSWADTYPSPYLCEWDTGSACSNDIVTFTAGTPAKAADVNANFDAHNCQIQALQTQVQALKSIVCTDHPTASVCQ
jgi:Lectin C-type domain